ncbi:MAG: hypothetical protein M1832_003602 [Thelocarpon impressellum]|nr:MAG: hypothetical protein M1832_003602 [Thelocarpon impressellum]
MIPWLDSLSEDWVSQPRSSSPSLRASSSAPSEASAVGGRSPKSRIPLPRTRRSSTSAAPPRGAFGLAVVKEQDAAETTGVLSSRSFGKGNREPVLGSPETVPSKSDGQDENRGRVASRTISSSYLHTTRRQGTVQQHKSHSSSPQKDRARQVTPEWKKRLLGGDAGYGERRDLFGPIGLENIFRPPTAQSPPKPRALPLAKLNNDMPSSPPTYTRTTRRSDETERTAVSGPPRRTSNARPSRGRGISGETDERNEEISPIILARRDTESGKVGFAVLDQPEKQLHDELSTLGMEDPELHARDASLPCSTAAHSRPRDAVGRKQSLPNDSMYSTREFVSKGGFINMRRGGYSSEDSFLQRDLSLSTMPLPELSFPPQEPSFDAGTPQSLPEIRRNRPSLDDSSVMPPTAPSPPPLPSTPTRTPPRKQQDESPRPRSSPLKLFGNHDTFTNDKLLRRMGQFEDGLDRSEAPGVRGRRRVQTHFAELDGTQSRTTSPDGAVKKLSFTGLRRANARVRSFGEGQLDGHEFGEEVQPMEDDRQAHAEEADDLTSLPELSVGYGTHFRPRGKPDSAEEVEESSSGRHARRSSLSWGSAGASQLRGSSDDAFLDPSTNMRSPERKTLGRPTSPPAREPEGKRAPGSPMKGRDTKRRRTYNAAELEMSQADGRPNAPEVKSPLLSRLPRSPASESHPEVQHCVGKKRKDARYDDNGQALSPELLAMRKILKARTPSGGQRKDHDIESAALEALQSEMSGQLGNRLSHETDSAKAREDFRRKATIERTAGVLRKHMLNETRKGSVTTQDFLDEATKIMEFIRAQGRPMSGSPSPDASELEGRGGVADVEAEARTDDGEDSEPESFTRPPSREISSATRPKRPTEVDPRVASHLRKYAEAADANGLISSSIRLSGEMGKPGNPRRSTPAEPMLEVDSEPSNIRITENSELRLKNGSGGGAVTKRGDAQVHSQGSNASSGKASSGRSDSKHVISPDKVSHLIPERIAGMIYDQARQTWVSRKSRKAPSETSEEDPLGDIPDLSVDEIAEVRRVQMAALADNLRDDQKDGQASGKDAPDSRDDVEPRTSAATFRPTTREGSNRPVADSSSIPSKFSRLTYSGPRTDTRATSWGDDPQTFAADPQKKGQLCVSTQATGADEVGQDEDFEHEILAHEGRATPPRPRRVRRDVTITFSSPVVSHVMETSISETTDVERSMADATVSGLDESLILEGSFLSHQGSKQTPSSKNRHGTARRVSLGGRSFKVRPISRIEEQNEESFQHSTQTVNIRKATFDVTVLAPHPEAATQAISATPPTRARAGNVSLHLTPLRDFTVNVGEETIMKETGRLATRTRDVSIRVESAVPQVTSTLVRTLTDVEPFEPYWDRLRQLDLRDRGLITLHQLNEFCGRLEEVDVSDNEIGELGGAPSSIRQLSIARNCISNMTAWSHLSNLQYLDVTGNGIESLEAFKCLVHLRELKADDNQITSLKGVFEMDGLMALSARRNRLQEVDFETAGLRRLTRLDLKGNRLTAVRGLHALPELESLELSGNALERFEVAESTPLSKLRSLLLAKNRLTALDVSALPCLRALRVDKNNLSGVRGLAKLRHMEKFSMREQNIPPTMDPDGCFELRKLNYSGNRLGSFIPRIDFLNLQHLELASCGLRTLPPDFGRRAKNVRVLNLNFNALRDLSPLRGMTRLQHLSAAGNRLSRLRHAVAVLSLFPCMTRLDLRQNPLTLGFYSSAATFISAAAAADLPPFSLAPGLPKADDGHRYRLDGPTAMRRRVYEMLIARAHERLKNLRDLDGLPFSVDDVLGSPADGAWERLEELGVIGSSPTKVLEGWRSANA